MKQKIPGFLEEKSGHSLSLLIPSINECCLGEKTATVHKKYTFLSPGKIKQSILHSVCVSHLLPLTAHALATKIMALSWYHHECHLKYHAAGWIFQQ